MAKTKLLFDTNSFESAHLFYSSGAKLYFSAIVFMELMTACSDTKELKSYQQAYKDAKDESILIAESF